MIRLLMTAKSVSVRNALKELEMHLIIWQRCISAALAKDGMEGEVTCFGDTKASHCTSQTSMQANKFFLQQHSRNSPPDDRPGTKQPR
jgi:hypothetical protein